ncbi:MAG: putative autotransporter protein putative Ig domain-containing protein, partial [bacterium]
VGLPTGTINIPYNQTITASGGTAPYTFSFIGTLPPGLTLDSAGVLSGTPTTLGTFNFTVTATDASGCTGMQVYNLTISCAQVSFSPSTLVAGLVGSPYDQAITINGVAAPITVNLMSGSLPPGLSLIPPGGRGVDVRIQGTPSTSGTFNFTLQVTDNNGCIGTQAYALVINCIAITVSPASLPNGQAGAVYSQAITASGGKIPYVFSLASGTLPPGLGVVASGGLVGTPTTAGTFNFTIQARDASGCTGARNYTISITGNAGTISFSAGSFTVLEGSAVAITVNRTGGSNGTVSVNYNTNNRTAIAGTHFINTSGALNFTNGDSSPKSFTIQTLANNAFEPNRT